MTTSEFILQARNEDVARVAMRARQYPDVDAAFALQQIEGFQKARTKLPTLAAVDGWIWPKRISMEQCSSEDTARYKQNLIRRLLPDCSVGADLTGGFGVDTFFMSEKVASWHYVEMQPELCSVASQNFRMAGRTNIAVHNTTAEDFLVGMQPVDVLFLDPARRDGHGGKVFRLEDCTPDISTLYSSLMQRCNLLILKLSPMLDIQEALRHLPDAEEVHIVAVRGEVKELLVVCRTTSTGSITTTAVNILQDSVESFAFTHEEEGAALCLPTTDIVPGSYLYEPNAAVLKAGAFRLVGQRFRLSKAAPNTHLYFSDTLQQTFPGRVFRATQVLEKQAQKALTGRKMNIICRNYPLRPDELKKKLKVQDGGNDYLLAFRLADKPVLVLAERLK